MQCPKTERECWRALCRRNKELRRDPSVGYTSIAWCTTHAHTVRYDRRQERMLRMCGRRMGARYLDQLFGSDGWSPLGES